MLGRPPRSALAHWLAVDAKLMPNQARNTGSYHLYRLINLLECKTVWFDPTFTRWKS